VRDAVADGAWSRSTRPAAAGRAVARELPTARAHAVWRVVGLSEIVRDQEAIFLQEYEPKVTVLDPRETKLVVDTTAGHRSSRLYLEAKLRASRRPPPSPCSAATRRST
jgi:hypothetical protein